MSPSVHKALRNAVLLCIDDNRDVLECEKAFLVDYFMPEMNGEEFAIEMRRLRPQAPIVMLSAAVDVPKQALKLVDAFIAKDHLFSQLLLVIEQLHECGVNPRHSYDI
jgi:CheY-like chemotaxis protein